MVIRAVKRPPGIEQLLAATVRQAQAYAYGAGPEDPVIGHVIHEQAAHQADPAADAEDGGEQPYRPGPSWAGDHPLRFRDNLTPQAWNPRPARTAMLRRGDERYAVVLARPRLPEIRFGSYDYFHQAASITTSLRQQRHSTQHVIETTVTVHPYIPGLGYTDPQVPTDPYQLATLIGDDLDGDGTGRNFPDLWARLHAQEGYERAVRIWRRASSIYDEDFPDEQAGQRLSDIQGGSIATS
ncbi:hypothetical protein ACFV0T_34175 [Streptomyces sp. NPDC059582]|uniref:hypothetical protein n=1 Tax=Streptomyces sp. NPDC059582 TaxID=3346875 RepID=UPI003691F9DD